MLADTHALCIGVSNYQHICKLSAAPLHDASDIAALLKDPQRAAYRPESVRLLLDGEATAAGIRGSLKALADKTGPDSTAFILFAGHGGRLAAGAHAGEYLLPIDANTHSPSTLKASGIGTDELAASLRAIKARKLLLVLDCCHAGGIGALRGAEEGGEPEDGLSGEALALLSQGRGRALLLASRADERALELRGDRNGLFTKHLLAGLRGGAVASGGLVRVFDLFDYVQRGVQAERPGQHPVFKAELEENFPIVRCPALAATPRDAPADDFRHDLFVHALERGPDRDWVRKVLRPGLERRGLRVLDADRFRPGVPSIKQMEQAVTQSRYTLAVLSEAYLASGLAELGDLMAQHLGTQGNRYRLLGLLRQPCMPRLGIRMAPLLDMSLPEDTEPELDRLAESVRQPL